jgi:hypothetical protein
MDKNGALDFANNHGYLKGLWSLENWLFKDCTVLGEIKEIKADSDTIRHAESEHIGMGEFRQLTGHIVAFNDTNGLTFYRF